MRIRKRTSAILASTAPMLALVGLILTFDGCDRAWRHKNSISRPTSSAAKILAGRNVDRRVYRDHLGASGA